MKRLVLLIAATALTASPALAQMNMNMPGMHMPGMKMPPPKKKAAKRKAAAKKGSAKGAKKAIAPAKVKAAPRKTRAKKPAAHQRGGMSTMPGMQMPQGQTPQDQSMQNMPGMQMPQGQTPQDQSMQNMPGMQMPQGQTPQDQSMQNMPGMQMPPGQSMEQMPGMTMPPGQHAGHDMNAPEPTVAPPPAEALQGPENAADTVYGTASMQASRTFLLTREHGGMTAAKLLVDELETRVRKGRDGYFVNAQGWYGGDVDKLWLKSEIEGAYGRSADQLELQALWSHAIDPWFNLQTGVRFDAEPRTRGRLVLGVEGLAPYWWEVGAAAFVSDRGDITARAEGYHDIRITQKLILQPRAQLDFALQDIPRERVGSGLSTVELGARLRYQFVPNFGPYVGLVYERALGRTARFVRADGESPGGLQFTIGLRAWF